MATCGSCGYRSELTFRFCPECGRPAAVVEGREQRKTVTVLFSDVTGSTALGESTDPEALRALLARYFERMKAIVESHGGTVEKFIGDAVMAVFGVPAAHEDDALRACRAAVEMRDAFPALGIAGRIGVNTGEVVTGTEERLATGDAVNVAARLEQAAKPGSVLIGAPTLTLVRDAVAVEPVEPLALKGKAKPVTAYRLLRVTGPVERAHTSRFVGRAKELSALAEAWDRTLTQARCELVTVVGDAGVGKSRLVAEALDGLEARVLRGRCLPYGEGITYWPVVEVLRQLEADRSRLVLDPVASAALGALLGQDGTASTDEIAWAFRKLLESVAGEGPLVAVFDDIQWAEDVLLELLEHVAFLSTGAPILLLCIARPELLDRHTGWSGVLRLQPLDVSEARTLMSDRIGDQTLAADVRERILRAAGGNPLFVEEMAAMVQTGADGDIDVPPTLQALIAARLDQLDRPERSVLERGAVEGEVFHQGVVQALTPQGQRLTTQLTALVRKQLIRPDRPLIAGEDAFRFHHLLIRDAAYEALPKAERATLHERFADWLADHGEQIVELDELLGYHLEQAYRYRRALGENDARTRTLASRAGDRLNAAGNRAITRQDFRTGRSLLERAADLLSDKPPDGRLEVSLAWARFFTGQGPDAVLTGLAEATERAAIADDRVTELGLRLCHAGYHAAYEPTETVISRHRRLTEEALPVLEAAGDEWGLAIGYNSRGHAADFQGLNAEVAAAAERVIHHARRADFPLLVNWAQTQVVSAQFGGTTPVNDCLRWLDHNPEVERRSILPLRDRLLAMLGRFDEAYRLQAEAADRFAELGVLRFRTWLELRRFDVAMLEDDATRAAESARRMCETAEETHELGNFMWFCCNHAQALLALGRDDEAEQWVEHGHRTAPSDDRPAQMLSRQARAKLFARRGDFQRAEQLAREAVTLARETDMLNAHAAALADLAEVRALASQDARSKLEQALALYERKGNVVMAKRTRTRLSEVSRSA